MSTKTLLAAILLAAIAIRARAADVTAVIAALRIVESGNNPNAVSKDGGAVGVLQIRRPMVREVNRILNLRRGTSVEHYSLEDRLDPVKSEDMARIFYTYWVPRWPGMDEVELGGRWYSPAGRAPEWYKNRIRKELR